jgi:hypothetical protein
MRGSVLVNGLLLTICSPKAIVREGKSAKLSASVSPAAVGHKAGATLAFIDRVPLFEIALVPVWIDHVASRTVNAQHSMM